MALSLPITRDVEISEQRVYTLRFVLCDGSLGVDPATVSASALPVFSRPLYRTGFFVPVGSTAPFPELASSRIFTAFEKLWRITGYRDARLGLAYAIQNWPIYSELMDSQTTALAASVTGGVLSVTIPFGATFTRIIYPSGYMSDDVTDPANSPDRYKYVVSVGSTKIAQGTINITIDLSNPPPPPPTLSVCSVATV